MLRRALRRSAALWLPLVAYLGVIFYLSSLSNPFALTGPPPVPAWVLHVAEYAVLSVLVLRALAGGFRQRPVPWHYAASLTFCVAVGAADEYWQSFTPERFSTGLDVLTDALGAALGAGIYFAWTRLTPTRTPP